MPILDEQRFPFGGPYADLLDLQQPLDVKHGHWPKRENYQEHVFFRLSDKLCDTLCLATRTFLPIEAHELTQMSRSHQILALSSEWPFRAHVLTATPTRYLRESFGSLELPSFVGLSEVDALASFHQDLLDTLLFMSGRLHQIAFSKRCFTIVGY